MMDKFRVIVADPPWAFGDRLGSRGAEANYLCMSLAEIGKFPLPPIADDAILFLWRVASMPNEALTVVDQWNFIPKTELVWLKRTASGKRHFGMGRTFRAEHETCIVATRGKIQPKLRNVRSTFEAPVGRHSQKPEAFFDIVESMFDGPYLEIFARRVRPGWHAIGNEI